MLETIRNSPEGIDVYEIFAKMNGEFSIMRIRQLCEQLVILNKAEKTKVGKKNKYKIIQN